MRIRDEGDIRVLRRMNTYYVLRKQNLGCDGNYAADFLAPSFKLSHLPANEIGRSSDKIYSSLWMFDYFGKCEFLNVT